MSTVRFVRNAVFGALAAACGAAWAVDEVEPNYPMESAQMLTLDSSLTVTVNAFLESGSADVFAFDGRAGDVVIVDIDGGAPNIDTIVALLGPGPSGPYHSLTSNDDSDLVPVDEGSFDHTDSYILPFNLPVDGVYYVGVTHWGTQVVDGGALLGGGGNPTGTYTVTISIQRQVAEVPQDPPASEPLPQLPAVQHVNIDIRPGQRAETAIVHLSRAKIPVAVLSSEDFDAMQIDTSTLTFGHSGDEQSLLKCHPKGIDVNRDGRRDMLCLFSVKAANFEPNDMAGFVKGRTAAGTQFEGQGLLKVVEPRKGRRDRDDDHDRRGRHR
jgi:hypothetical protein